MKITAIEPYARAPRALVAETGVRWDPQPWAIAVAAAAVAIAIQSLWLPLDADISWLLTVSEQIGSGDRLYVDIVEVNPPASIWLYLPLVRMAHLIGIRPEAMVVAAFAAAGVASVLATVRLSSRLDDSPSAPVTAAAASFVALLLPMGLFAQREHAALLLALPALAAVALVADGKPLPTRVSTATGIAAGLIVVLKPFFLVTVIAPALYAAWKRRSLVPMAPAIVAASLTVLAYAAAVLLFAQAYFGVLPTLARTYGPMHEQLWKVFLGPAVFPATCLGLALLLEAPRAPVLSRIYAFGAAGFYLAAVIQAKNYANHAFPAAALAFAAIAMQTGSAPPRTRRTAVAAALALVGAFAMYHWAIRPDPAVAAAIRKVAPPAPKIIALSPELATGHPVTRNVGGQWVGSRAALYTASGARFVGMKDEAVRNDYREDISSFARDVRNGSPDVVLVDVPAKDWLMREPAIERVMAGYAPAARSGDTEIWVRRSATH